MSDDLLLGRQLDEYRLDALLGRGGMARVYRGFDVGLKRKVAIKVIDPPLQSDSDYVARFEREAQAIARLNHPHIVRVYRYGQANRRLYIAMELVDGPTLALNLASYQEKKTFISFDEIRRIMHQICWALDYAHSQGVIHRDVKPANILLGRADQAILTDFGLALQVELGTQGEIFGTAEYMAPEQVVSSAQVVPQSDLYSMGVILYEMVTNRLPFEASHPDDVALMQVGEPPPSPRRWNPEIGTALEAVILKALAKKPQARYSSGILLAQALNQALQPKTSLAPQFNSNDRRQSMSGHPTVFISYSHEDEDEKEALLTHLRVLAKDGLIDVWSDDQIGAGVTWQREVEQAIARAQVAILLISANYLASDFIVDDQIPKLLQRRQTEGLIIFPVIAKACRWEGVTWLKQMDVRPKHGRPVWREEGKHAQEELASIVGEVEKIIKSSMVDVQTDEWVGTFLGKYRLLNLIGQGGVGKVYETYHPGFNRRMAIKVMDSHRMSDSMLERFMDEASAVIRLRHNHIVRVYDFDQAKGRHYMVMELIEGPTLEEKIRSAHQKNQPVSMAQTVKIITALADALDCAHAEGIVHHDLKPANIMFTTPNEEGQLLLTDFGVARMRNTASQTIPGMFLGTPNYTSPEQAQGQRGDRRSDIYSLGVILYELVTGRRPFEADTSEAVMRQHINLPVPHPTQIKPGLSQAVEQVILKALQKNPADRYPTAGELVQALQQALKAEQPALEKETHDDKTGQSKPGDEHMSDQPVGNYQPRNLSKAVDRFERGTALYQQALDAAAAGHLDDYEKALLHATPLIVGALEWTLKIYLRQACSGTKDYAKLNKANFHTLMTLMKDHASPPMLTETIKQLYDARDMRNAAEHDAVTPAKEELRHTIKTIRQVMQTYLPQQEPPQTGQAPKEPSALTAGQRRRLKRKIQSLETNIERMYEILDGLHREHDLETRSDERRRIQARIDDNEKQLANYEDELDDLESELEGS